MWGSCTGMIHIYYIGVNNVANFNEGDSGIYLWISKKIDNRRPFLGWNLGIIE